MKISEHDKTILRKLAEKISNIASDPIHAEKKKMWTKLNNMEKVKPMVLVDELDICWNELDAPAELETTDEFLRQTETALRRLIFHWENMPGDMIIENKIDCPLVIHDTGFGMEACGDHISQGQGAINSTHFSPQIKEPKDIEKIQTPKITFDEKATEQRYQFMNEIFDGIIPVKKTGVWCTIFSPWDWLVTWWGVTEVLTDIALRPQMVKDAMERLTDASLASLKQWEELGLLELNNCNRRVGTGGYGYVGDLPADDFDGTKVRTKDMWAGAMAQIFSEVSPAMHREFALEYEMRWMKLFPLSYYGCCEQLHNKLDILAEIPNLRKVSMSPWADLEKGAAKIRGKYVLSYKPSPFIFAEKNFDPAAVRENLRANLRIMQDCSVEIIMKDVSTVKCQPNRLAQWAKIAAEVTEEFA